MKNLITIAKKESYKWTSNRYYYNRLRKGILDSTGEISCSYCSYHEGDNNRKKYYGGQVHDNDEVCVKYPNWKFVSKNKKQWMKKPKNYVIIHEYIRDCHYIEINF
ncbi:hypothetical protein M0Q50_02100 [bacterium]|jgi:hypothetical protein|nr:hypothetical protein [bacterium]